jgi:hypothetical protein
MLISLMSTSQTPDPYTHASFTIVICQFKVCKKKKKKSIFINVLPSLADSKQSRFNCNCSEDVLKSAASNSGKQNDCR